MLKHLNALIYNDVFLVIAGKEIPLDPLMGHLQRRIPGIL